MYLAAQNTNKRYLGRYASKQLKPIYLVNFEEECAASESDLETDMQAGLNELSGGLSHHQTNKQTAVFSEALARSFTIYTLQPTQQHCL